MAINVNTVYTTVLSILNKEQRGYITPDEFNKLATQVQLDIFENYFEDLNQQLRVPQTDNTYANRQKNIDNLISIFKTIGGTTIVYKGAIVNFRKALAMDVESANVGVSYSSGGADYAEWLEKANPNEHISFGEVVGVKGGKISKTFVDADQFMAITSNPTIR